VRVDFINILVAISSLSPGQCCIIKEHDEEVYMVTNGEMRVRAGSFSFLSLDFVMVKKMEYVQIKKSLSLV